MKHEIINVSKQNAQGTNAQGAKCVNAQGAQCTVYTVKRVHSAQSRKRVPDVPRVVDCFACVLHLEYASLR